MLSAHFHQHLTHYASQFRSARPFRHVVMEPFFDEAQAQQLLNEFPAFDPARARNEAGEIGLKAVVERIRGLGGAFTALDDLIQRPCFLAQLSQLTGIPDLLYDPHYFGGGTHENRSGQDLDLHIDFNLHPETGWHRRLNLIVYLNPVWEDCWGGALELFADPRDPHSEQVRVLPLFNRAVLFETTEHSWHGFSRIELPIQESRCARSPDRLKPAHLPNPSPTRDSPPSEVPPSTSDPHRVDLMSDPGHRGGSRANMDSRQTSAPHADPADAGSTSDQPMVLSRRSVALYFYSATRPAAETGPNHSTIYVDRPIPEWVRPGHVLSTADAQELQIAFARRDQHNQRLYRDLQQLQARLDDAVSLLKRSPVERLAWYVRRLLRRR
jgi:hypothetical protein